MRADPLFEVILFFTASVVIVGVLFFAGYELMNSVSKDQDRLKCEEYERAGVLPKNSCNCTEKLFKSWSESYDWIDSCRILKARG